MIRTFGSIILILAIVWISREIAMIFEPGFIRYAVGYATICILFGAWLYWRETILCFFGGIILRLMDLLGKAEDDRWEL